MRRVTLTLDAAAVEDVLDALMPRLPRGVYLRDLGAGRAELTFYGDDLSPPEIDALVSPAVLGHEEDEVADSPAARRARIGRVWEIAGRLRVRSPADPPGDEHLPELVIQPGAFGTGAHPTTRMSLELMFGLEPAGGFADLGCGAGVLAVAAAKLGWAPVFGVDLDQRAVDATHRNAELNGVEVSAVRADLLEVPPPPARTLAANMPFTVHERAAAALDPRTEHVIASGVIADQADATVALYGLTERARLATSGWVALWLAR